MTLIHFYQGIIMKKTLLLAVTAIALAACADTRNHIHKDSTQWETNVYNVKRDTQELTDSQKKLLNMAKLNVNIKMVPQLSVNTK